MLPPIKANMNPPANFWDGDTFKMPGMEARVGANGQVTPQPNPFNQPTNNWAGYLQANPDVRAAYDQNIGNVQSRYGTAEDYARLFHYPQYGRNENRSFGAPAQTPTPSPTRQPIPYMGGMMANPFLQGLM